MAGRERKLCCCPYSSVGQEPAELTANRCVMWFESRIVISLSTRHCVHTNSEAELSASSDGRGSYWISLDTSLVGLVLSG